MKVDQFSSVCRLQLLNCLLYTLSRATMKHNKKYYFQKKRDPFPYFKYFKMRKQHFHYILRGAASKNGRTFCLDKRLRCNIVVEMFVSRGVFYAISTWKLVGQDFYLQFPISLVWAFEYVILDQIQNSIPQ